MTSFVAWLGADSRGPTSVYFASDSRLSWGTDSRTWDNGQKLFRCQRSPEIFGFTGYLLLPKNILHRFAEQVDQGLLGSLAEITQAQRAQQLLEATRRDVRAHLYPFNDDFSLFYASRSGSGMSPKSVFRLYEIYCEASTRTVTLYSLSTPSASSVLLTHGTGKAAVDDWTDRWRRSDQGGTSRAVFSGFCDALRAGSDKRSGGEPQLVGLHLQGDAKMFGIVTARGPSIQGALQDGVLYRPSVIEWRDELFQRVRPDGSLVKSAQVHARSQLPPSLT